MNEYDAANIGIFFELQTCSHEKSRKKSIFIAFLQKTLRQKLGSVASFTHYYRRIT
jgi:hypothetical protein